MRVDAEKNGPELYQHERDTRMTKDGKFLREHHLDYLEHRSWWFDAKILFLTFMNFAFGKKF